MPPTARRPAGKWPDLVSMDLVAKDYKTLRYKTADGVGLECSLSPVLFSMEDQRNYGDSSFKAYNTILAGPEAKAGEAATVAVTLKVTGAKASLAVPYNMVTIQIGKEIPGAKLPKIIAGQGLEGGRRLPQPRCEARPVEGRAEIQFGYKPSSHLPDDDTFMENRSTLAWQLKTLHALAPKAKLRVDPIHLTDGDDPRAKGAFAAAWMIGALKYLALGGADEACFKMDGGKVAEFFSKDGLAGSPICEVEVKAEGQSPVEVLAVSRYAIWIANRTDRPQPVTVAPPGFPANHIINDSRGEKKPYTRKADGSIDVDLGPYEACSITYLPMPAL